MENLSSFENSFEIKIDFEKCQGNPSRIFQTMTGLIESMQLFDQHLAAIINSNIQTTLLLQDIESGSLKSKLKTIIERIPDDVLKEGQVNKLIGHFLFEGKHLLIDWCSKEREISARSQIKQLQEKLTTLAEKTEALYLPAYIPIDTSTLLSDINLMSSALRNLDEADSAVFASIQGTSHFNKHLVISKELISEMVIKESIVSEGEKIFKIKKPDYLGYSKWEFKYAGHVIYAKIQDTSWLEKFQTNVIKIQPGDSLRVDVKEETNYGYNNEIVQVNYEILRVKNVIAAQKYLQGDLF